MPSVRRDESHNLSLEEEQAQLVEIRSALPGWYVWYVWHCGWRVWHAMPAHLVPAGGPPASGSTRPQPDRITTDTRDALIRACTKRGLENWS